MITSTDLLALRAGTDDYEFCNQVYEGLTLPEMDTVLIIVDVLQVTWEEALPIALGIWAALRLSDRIVDHVYEEDQVLF